MEEQIGVEAPRERQSKSRKRPGYSWTSARGLTSGAIEEIFRLKVELALNYRDDVVEAILGEIGLLDVAARKGYPLLDLGKGGSRGGGYVHIFLPDDLIAAVTQASKLVPFQLRPPVAMAAALMGVRDDFEMLARRGLARKLESAA